MVEPLYITVSFAFGYLLLYPGLAVFPGLLNWSTDSLYKDEVKQAKAEFDPIFDAYAKQDVKTVAADNCATIGGRLFQTYCVQCHGTDMRGSGFSNLVDGDWLYPVRRKASSRPSWKAATVRCRRLVPRSKRADHRRRAVCVVALGPLSGGGRCQTW